MHIKRANYQALVWKHAHERTPKLPGPAEGHGWCMGQDGLEYDWCDGPFLPQVRGITCVVSCISMISMYKYLIVLS